LVGSTEEDVGFAKRTTESGIEGLKKFCREICPAVADLPIEKTWSGLRPATTDGLPYLGLVPGLSNALVAAGHYRSGLHLSPGTAVVMSQLIRGETTTINLAPFRVGRG
jgi:glycine oxidase